MTTPCTRRPGSYWTTCTCDNCRPLKARHRKLYYVKGNTRVPNDLAWEHLAPLIERDWSARAIASAVGVKHDYFCRHLAEYKRGRRVYLGPVIAELIINHGHPTEGQVDAEPTRRRLRALARIGWGLNTLARETGIKHSTLAMIRNRNERVSARIANTVRGHYDRLHMTPGDDDQARRDATAKGWPPPLAWTNIDDPNEQPVGVRKDWHAGPGHDSFDHAVVERILAGEWDLPSTAAEKAEVCRLWVARGGSRRQLAKLSGLKVERYLKEAAA